MRFFLTQKDIRNSCSVLENGKKVMLSESRFYFIYRRNCRKCFRLFHYLYWTFRRCRARNRILIDDGLIELEVKEVTENAIHCHVVNGGELGEKKGINVPNVKVNLPVVTEKDNWILSLELNKNRFY